MNRIYCFELVSVLALTSLNTEIGLVRELETDSTL